MHSPEWMRQALKDYFASRPGVSVNTVDLVAYFRVVSVLDAAQELVKAGWLIKTDDPFPKFRRFL